MLANKTYIQPNMREKLDNSSIKIYHNKASKYGYESYEVKSSRAKELYDSFPDKLGTNHESALFIAAVITEPSRYAVSHISNMLLLNKDSNLTDASPTPPRTMTPEESAKMQEKKDAGTYKSTGAFEHTSMTQSGSHPGKESNKPYPKDGQLGFTNENDPNKNVTDRDLIAIKQNEKLLASLTDKYKGMVGKPEDQIIAKLAKEIRKYLDLPKA
jgi:hypothetical protein